MTTVEIVEDGQLDRPYPVAVVDGRTVHRRYGSWLIDCDGGRMAEPEVFGIEPELLQELPEVRAFDQRRRREAAARHALAAVEAETEAEAREWVKGDRVMYAGSKARVIGPSREPGKIRIKMHKRVYHVDPAGLVERSRR